MQALLITMIKMMQFLSLSFLDKIIPSFAKLVDKASFGFVGLPLAFTKAGDVMIKQMKEFFSGIAKASSYKTSKSIAKSEVKDEVKNLKQLLNI